MVVTFSVAVFVGPGVTLTKTLLKPVFVELSRLGTGWFEGSGEIVAVTLTLPVKRFALFSVRVEVWKEPADTDREEG